MVSSFRCERVRRTKGKKCRGEEAVRICNRRSSSSSLVMDEMPVNQLAMLFNVMTEALQDDGLKRDLGSTKGKRIVMGDGGLSSCWVVAFSSR
jgi:hypothetical protein